LLDQQCAHALAKVRVCATLHRDEQLQTKDIRTAEGPGPLAQLPDQSHGRWRARGQGLRSALQPLVVTRAMLNALDDFCEIRASAKSIDSCRPTLRICTAREEMFGAVLVCQNLIVRTIVSPKSVELTPQKDSGVRE
jgi:hypothetical protein